jgi:hypothetical protein
MHSFRSAMCELRFLIRISSIWTFASRVVFLEHRTPKGVHPSFSECRSINMPLLRSEAAANLYELTTLNLKLTIGSQVQSLMYCYPSQPSPSSHLQTLSALSYNLHPETRAASSPTFLPACATPSSVESTP